MEHAYCALLGLTVFWLGSAIKLNTIVFTQSGRIGKVVASHAAVARSSPADVALIYTMYVALRGCDQSIGSTVSDAIVRSWLWSTATRSSPLGCFSTLLQVVDN